MSKRELTEKEAAFIDALITYKGDVVKAAQAADINASYGYTLTRKLKAEIIESARDVLAMHAHKAAFTFADALDTDNPVHRDRLESAKQILDRIGIVKEEKVQVETNLPGVFILPAKDDTNS